MEKISRRRTLLGLGAVAPTLWVKPVIDAVHLPAHASTTMMGCPAGSFLLCDGPESVEGDETDGLQVLFDGTNLSFALWDCCRFENQPETNGNLLFTIDVDDSDPPAWGITGFGGDNWDFDSNESQEFSADQTVRVPFREPVTDTEYEATVVVSGLRQEGESVCACASVTVRALT
ncbi:MAG: hypothetical protein AAF353_00630 [Pseudomonadota bacterium]